LGHRAPDDLAHMIALLKAARAPHEEAGSHWRLGE
jgi:hypothetical protein